MLPLLARLIDLQKIDNEIIEVKKRLELLPKQLETARSQLAKEKEELEKTAGEIKNLQKKRQQLERDALNQNDHMAKAKVKLTAVKTNKEYTALLAEIDAVKQQITKIEDDELALMETLEQKGKELPRFEEHYKKEDAQFQAFKKLKEADLAASQKELAELQKRRAEAVPGIEPLWAGHYEKVYKLRGTNVVVTLGENVCGGCFQQLLPQTIIDIKRGDKMHQCQHCNRVIYWIDDKQTQAVAPE